MKLKIAYACDHRGLGVKKQIIDILKSKGYDVCDCGTDSEASCDYADFMLKAAELVGRGECFRAVGVCYTGIGSAIAANKVRGVRAALVHCVEEARLSRAHNDSNMLILGAGFLDLKLIPEILDVWLQTAFEGGRHEQRVNKIKAYEQSHGR
ncbi:MAG: RpiB/LacA/LacB family sugar-phosphate isomerase [Candidatus Omnitrophota bacterium]|jgi:ribose 5-phosphate isomerase B